MSYMKRALEQRPTLKEKIRRRVRRHRLAAAGHALFAAAQAAYADGAFPWGSSLIAPRVIAGILAAGGLLWALVHVMRAGQGAMVLRDPVFFLLAVRHDLNGEDFPVTF